MNHQAKRTDEHKKNESRRNKSADNLVQQQVEIFQFNIDIELAFTPLAISEMIGHFAQPNLTGARSQQIDQDLEAAAG